MIKIAVCDDQEKICISMKNILCKHNLSTRIHVDCFLSGSELFNGFVKMKYDIILLDIELSDNENGMIISNKIKDIYPNVIIIFFTGKCGYERKLLSFEPFRYLNKPIKDTDLINSVEAAIKRLNGWEEKFFTFKVNGIVFKIKIKEIMFLTSRSPYISIKCIDDQAEFRGKMDDIENEFGKISNDFVRVSKSYLVNKRFIKSYTSKEIILSNGEKITITRKYTKRFSQMINEQ